MGKSSIEWTEATWNPTTGCTKVSPGCAHCYAETLTKRYAGSPGWPAKFQPWVSGNDTLVLHPDRLDAPLKWRKPARVFVNSMSDLFHEDVPFEFIYDVFVTMAATPQHTYQILTKRPARMREFCQRISYIPTADLAHLSVPGVSFWPNAIDDGIFTPRPLPNVWLGVTVENQRWADERIPILLDTPAAVRFISAEPLLGPVDLARLVPASLKPAHEFDPIIEINSLNGYVSGIDEYTNGRDWHLNWVIVGGESGHKHRPFNPDWARRIVAQCRDAGVACFVKQLGGVRPGNKLEDLPDDLRVREYPEGGR